MTAGWSVPGFTAVRELGRGGGGTVVLANDEASGTSVAIKYLGGDLLGDEAFRTAFRTEAQLLAGIEAPNVVRLYEYVEGPHGAAIVMELVPGTSLRETLTEHGPTDPESALSVLKGSLLGLAAAHAVGVVHRDYKPENVLVDLDGESKLVDFGVAGRSGTAGDGSGTPAYMPPEQWAGGPDSPSGDIYSATATFVECVTGRQPFAAPDLATLRDLHETAPIPAQELPEPLRGLAARGLAKDPARRPADASSFIEELERAAVAGYGAGWEERGKGALARRASLLALLLPAAGVVAGTGALATVLGSGGVGTTGLATTGLATRLGATVLPRGLRPTVLTAATALVVVGGLVGVVVAQGGPTGAGSTDQAAAPPAPGAAGPAVAGGGQTPVGIGAPPAAGSGPAAGGGPAEPGPGSLPVPPAGAVPGGPGTADPGAPPGPGAEGGGPGGGTPGGGPGTDGPGGGTPGVGTPGGGPGGGGGGGGGDGGTDTPPKPAGGGSGLFPIAVSADASDGESPVDVEVSTGGSDGGSDEGGSDDNGGSGLLPVSVKVDADLSDGPSVSVDASTGSSDDSDDGDGDGSTDSASTTSDDSPRLLELDLSIDT